ncbi:MAG: glutamate-1-semialdehyde 2,1-aminomutase [Verrucomicrobia bacterium]|nr:glutamate-1-semialdehyde 2,1-aminomutase [Verrucomicrobiota bacterium]
MLAENQSQSDKLMQRAKALIPGGVNSPVRAFRSVGGTPFFTRSAQGARLTTADGDSLIDFVCTWGPALHGHNHPVIRSAIADALQHGTSFGTPNPYEVEMAEAIARFVPSIQKVRMCNSGTEATMSCIRLARGFTGRSKIVKFAGCYHGHVDSLLVKAGSGALTHGHPDSAGIPPAIAAETLVLPYNDIGALEQCFAAHGETIAGVIVESYPANCGLILPLPGYLQRLRQICSGHGALLIFDEVMTGFRLARGGVQELEHLKPDLTALGKVIGGGLPVGAFGGRADVMDYLAPEGPVYQAGTLSGNPLALSAGLAALQLIESHDPYGRLQKMGQAVAAALREAANEKGIALQVPQTGSMFAFFFSSSPVTNYDRALASDASLFRKVFHFALKRGVYLPPSAYETCFISTAHDQPTIDQACEVLSDAIRSL